MNLSLLPKIVTKRKKRIGRGLGSGKGSHTVGRGQKGQKSRRKIGVAFFGTKMKKSLLKRLPFQRGKNKLKPHKKPVIVNVKHLAVLPDGATVSIDTLVGAGIIEEKAAKRQGVKIIGKGKLDKPLNLKVPATKGVQELIKKAGGTIV